MIHPVGPVLQPKRQTLDNHWGLDLKYVAGCLGAVCIPSTDGQSGGCKEAGNLLSMDRILLNDRTS